MLNGASVTVTGGEAVALVGENGAGKSTMLRICAGLIAADRGRLAVRGRIGYCELVRRRVALALLTALPLAFYEAQAGHSDRAPVTGGIAMAFSLAGASVFTALTSRGVDQRPTLAGYRPIELLIGRLILLEAFGVAVAALFSIVMVLGSSPAHPWIGAPRSCVRKTGCCRVG